jgi:hypothetical protein
MTAANKRSLENHYIILNAYIAAYTLLYRTNSI